MGVPCFDERPAQVARPGPALAKATHRHVVPSYLARRLSDNRHKTVTVATLNIRARFRAFSDSPVSSDKPGLFCANYPP